LAKHIHTPKSVDRYRSLGDPSLFEEADIQAVRTFGYDIRW